MADYSTARILLVDDSLPMRTITSMILRGLGFPNQRFAEDEDTAFQLIREYTPDLIITDITRPSADGLQRIRTVRNDFPSPLNTTQILIITAYATEAHVRACLASGVDQMLIKPLAPASLALRLNVLMTEDRQFVREGGYFGPRRNAPSAQKLVA